jgi:hypothetical protein
MGNICYQYRQASGLWWEDRFRPVVDGVTNLTLNFILVQNIGVAGVMLSTILCHVFLDTFWGSSILFHHYFTEEKQSAYILRLLYFAVITSVSCAIAMWICHFIPQSGTNVFISLLYLLLRGTVALSVSVPILLLASRKLPEYGSARLVVSKFIKRQR